MTKSKKRKKLPTLRKLRKLADKLWQQVVQQHKECLVCPGKTNVGHHFFPKHSSNNLRYLTDNGIPLCVKCHFKLHRAEDPSIIITIVEKRGIEWYKWLKQQVKVKVTPNRQWYSDKIQDLQGLLNASKQKA